MSDFEPSITHGESVIDRKSVFQGHSAAINQVEHVNVFLAKLKENRKIENAFHNMWAYRIDKSDPDAKVASKSASIIQDCDDDGEQAAGGRLLNLLQILNVVNVMVVVTRWYGGIQLGPARFKHINNAARDSLVKGGFVDDGRGESSNTSLQSKVGKSKNKKKGK
jgi:putative IMPACT (imprinted ancient) family translation regulator